MNVPIPRFNGNPKGLNLTLKSLLEHDIWNLVESRAESWYWIKGVGSRVGWLPSSLSTCWMNAIQMPCASAERLRWTLSAALVRGSFTAIAIASQQAAEEAPFGHDHGSSFTLRPHRPPPRHPVAPFLILPDNHRDFLELSGAPFGQDLRFCNTIEWHYFVLHRGEAHSSSACFFLIPLPLLLFP